jgi:hypothetical protein
MLDGTTREAVRLSSDGGRFVITAGDAEQNAHGSLGRRSLHECRPAGLETERGQGAPKLVTTFELFTRVKEFVARESRRTNSRCKRADTGPQIFDGRGTPAVSKGEFVFVTGS